MSRLLSFCITTLCDWSTKLAPLLNQWESKPNPIVFWPHAFSRAWRQVHVFASNSDLLFVLFTSVAIGRSNFFGFGLRHSIGNRSIQQYDQFTNWLCLCLCSNPSSEVCQRYEDGKWIDLPHASNGKAAVEADYAYTGPRTHMYDEKGHPVKGPDNQVLWFLVE